MKIKNIKISNLMNFQYIEDLDSFEGINFEKDNSDLDLNILIGANGSGKSNFINIINQFIRNLILDYGFDPNVIINNKENKSELKKSIILNPKTTFRINKHLKYQDKESKIEISLRFFENDFDNISFVCKNVEKINAILDKYSNLSYRFPKIDINEVKETIQEITISATFDEKKQNFIIDRDILSDLELFVLICIQEKELLYICTRIYNNWERQDGDKYRHLMNNNFTVLSAQRIGAPWQYLNDVNNLDNYIFGENNNGNQNMEGYYQCLNKIWDIISTSDEHNLYDCREERLYKSDFWKNLNKYIQSFLHKQLVINYVQESINLQLQNDNGDISNFDDLGSGEQSLLLIIFSLVGNNLHNGFMIIDGPELYIHPQMQKKLSLVLDEISKKQGTQFILSTYSALFINENNITNVYRFSNVNGCTKVYTPYMKISSDDAQLVHLLRYENLSKIFFVNKIIMVEGDSDLYFFSNYLKWLQSQDGWEYITESYEIVNINGKGSYKIWHKFLNKFGIENYFIGDWDNTVDYGFFTSKEISKYYQLANRHIKNNKAYVGDYYNRLVATIKKFYPQKYRRIIEGIESLYIDNIFILKLGAIESYPCLERKGLQYMINFCNEDFEYWLVNPQTNNQRKELLDIFSVIFDKDNQNSNIFNPF